MKAANNLAKAALEPPPRSGLALGNRVRAWGVNPWGGSPIVVLSGKVLSSIQGSGSLSKIPRLSYLIPQVHAVSKP